ncbi:NAD-binding protein [Mycena belliarum]|uniref:NAD-binding protein n=1 Tax=Mycena belliarum TaxID=1033014 RepID=A0AAD6Y0M8_9AGAR|nr:NAD-binding protein [Mycena belliae]
MSAQTTTKFLITGATGYIGGTVLTRFLEHPNAEAFHFTALVRDPKKAAIFEELGVHTVVGSHKDAALVEQLASEADVVLSIADCDDLGAANATLAGLKKRHAKLGSKPIFIHTVDILGVLIDDAKGMHSNAVVYDDSDADQIETLAPTQQHRNVDLAITQADAKGYIKSYIILPSLIFGLAKGRLVDLGVQNPHSMALPYLITAALDRGQAGMVGEGKNVWQIVDVDETADLYIKLYDAIVADEATGHGRNGFYFAANGEQEFYPLVKAIGTALVALGKSTSAEPTTFTQAELDKYFGGSAVLGTNSRCRATRSLSLGWKPVKSPGDMLESVKPEVEAIIKKKSRPVVWLQ